MFGLVGGVNRAGGFGEGQWQVKMQSVKRKSVGSPPAMRLANCLGR